MLYPQKNEPLIPDKFLNPSRENRAVTFWAWNNKLDAEELCNQIEALKKMGFVGLIFIPVQEWLQNIFQMSFLDVLKRVS